MGPYCVEKNLHRHFRMLFAPEGGTSINESQKEDTGQKNHNVLYQRRKTPIKIRKIYLMNFVTTPSFARKNFNIIYFTVFKNLLILMFTQLNYHG